MKTITELEYKFCKDAIDRYRPNTNEELCECIECSLNERVESELFFDKFGTYDLKIDIKNGNEYIKKYLVESEVNEEYQDFFNQFTLEELFSCKLIKDVYKNCFNEHCLRFSKNDIGDYVESFKDGFVYVVD